MLVFHFDVVMINYEIFFFRFLTSSRPSSLLPLFPALALLLTPPLPLSVLVSRPILDNKSQAVVTPVTGRAC